MSEKESNNYAKKESNNYAAVDLNQFRNTVVGQGYQAKHVVRQRGASYANRVKIIDRTKKPDSDLDKKAKKKKHAIKKSIIDQKLSRYLQNAGLRQFRRELESILQSS